MKRALLYLRVSTSKQDEGYSIPMQRDRLVSYCKAMGWAVAGVYVDPGFSGSTLERPGMVSLINAVNEGRGDVVLVYKLDRLSRSQRDVLYVLEDIFEPRGVSFVSMQESFDTSSVYGKAMLGILSVFAQMERQVITERTMMGRAGRAEKGYFHGGGTDPIGYDYIDGELRINDEEAEQVRMVYQLFADGYTVTEITRRMDGYQTKHGGWSHTSTVGNVLDNPLYAGTIHFDGVTGDGRHEPIVSKELNSRVKVRRERLRRAEASGDSSYLLTGMIYCAGCGARYFPNKRPNGRVVYSCHSRAKKNRKMVKDENCKAPHIPVEELDAMVEEKLLWLASDLRRVDSIAKKRAAQEGGKVADSMSEEVKRLDNEINNLMDLLQRDSLVSVGEIAERLESAHAKRTELLPVDHAPKSYDIEVTKMILREVRASWDVVGLRGRRAFLLQLVDEIRIDVGVIDIQWSI